MLEWKHPTESRLRYALFPLAMLYWGIVFWRNIFYTFGFFISRKLPTKVISIGNITAGGTGKTPAVIYLAKLFLKNGIKVGVLSRGYGRKTAGTQLVTDGEKPVDDWRNFGDEPTLIAQKLPDVPVVVDSNRHRGGMFLIKNFGPDIIIMDDAFQHRAIERDIDIVLINSQDTRAEHKLLPYGFLREPWMSLKRADLLIFTKSNIKKPATFLIAMAKQTKRPWFQSELISGSVTSIDGKIKEANKGMKILAISAIGDTRGFIKTLKNAGFYVVDAMTFVDHYDYTQADVEKAKKKIMNSTAEMAITTTKDVVKLSQLDLSGLDIYSIEAEFKLSQGDEKKLMDIIGV